MEWVCTTRSLHVALLPLHVGANCYQTLKRVRHDPPRTWGQETLHSPLHYRGGEPLHGEAQFHRHPLPDGVRPQAHQDLGGPAHPLQVRVPVPSQLVLHLPQEARTGQCAAGRGLSTGRQGSLPTGHTHVTQMTHDQTHASQGTPGVLLPSPEWRICPAYPEPVSAPRARFPPSQPAPGGNAPAWLPHKPPPETGTCRGEKVTLLSQHAERLSGHGRSGDHMCSPPGFSQVGCKKRNGETLFLLFFFSF